MRSRDLLALWLSLAQIFPVGHRYRPGSITDDDRANPVQIAIKREGYQRVRPDHRHARSL